MEFNNDAIIPNKNFTSRCSTIREMFWE